MDNQEKIILSLNSICEKLELICLLIGEKIIMENPNDKYHVLKMISEYVSKEDD